MHYPCISEPIHGEHCYYEPCVKYVAQFDDPSDLYIFLAIGHWVTAISLLVIGLVWNVKLCRQTYKKTNKISWLRIVAILFAVLTAIFALIRFYLELGKPLGIAGALHNLCEWVFVIYAIYPKNGERMIAFIVSVVWITCIICTVIIIQSFPEYLLIEQITGAGMDFLLTIVWYKLDKQNKNHKTNIPKHIFEKPLRAHAIHLLFTIFALIISNFIVGQNLFLLSFLLEISIYVSAFFTHYWYTQFVTDYEKYIDFKPTTGCDSCVLQHPKSININYCGYGKRVAFSPTARLLFLYIISMLLAAVPTYVIPKTIMVLNDGKHCDLNNCNLDDFVGGTAVARIRRGMYGSFEYRIKSVDLVNIARGYPGNIDYYFTKSMFEPNTYVFREKWKSIDHVQKWMKYAHENIFDNYTKSMMEDGKWARISGYEPLQSNLACDKNSDIGVGSIFYIFTQWNGCMNLWHDMIDFNNCEWILGCNNTRSIDQLNGERILYMTIGKFKTLTYVRNYENFVEYGEGVIQYNYSMSIKELNRTSNVLLIYDENMYGMDSCVGTFTYHTNINVATVDEIHESFTKNNIPFLQEKYQEYH